MSTTIIKHSVSPTELRARKLLEQPFRMIYHPDFDEPKKRRAILGNMPDYDDFQKQRKKVQQLRQGDKISPEMRPCYEEPLLNREQEHHLFKQMNFYKHQAKKLMNGLNPRRCSPKRLDKIEFFLGEAKRVRNQIGNSNFRLATQLLRKQSSFYREHSLTDGLLSDAYFDVLKAIDYFNFNLGNKFSTYCTWVLRKNFSRDMKNQAKYQERFTTGMEEPLNELQDGDDGYKAEITYENNRGLVDKLLELLADSDCNGDVQRQVYAIEEWFGLHGKEHRTLDNISRDMDVTKERVRQLKEKGLELIRQKVKELGIKYEDAKMTTTKWPEGTTLHKTQDVCAWPDKTDKEWLCAAAFPAPAGIRPLYVTGRGLVQPTWFATGYGLTEETAEAAAFDKYKEIVNCNHNIEPIAHVDLPDPQPKVYLLDGDAVCSKCQLYLPFYFMNDRLFASMNLATLGHNDQKRKYSGDPYIIHPRQVYNKTAFWKPKRLEEDRIVMGCAAWNHDLREDCPQISDKEIIDAGGHEAFQLVVWLTNPSKGVKKPRAYRKAMDRDHILQAPQAAKIIKIIDRNCNLNDLKECTELDFLALYAGESRLLWENIKDADEKLAAELLSSIEMVERRSHGDSQG